MAPQGIKNPLRFWIALAVLLVVAANNGQGAWANPFLGSPSSGAVTPVQSGGPAPAPILQGQLELRARLAEYFSLWEKGASTSLFFIIIGVAFLYGALHALGPGHRKTVVFAIYLSRPSPWWEPIAMSLGLAGLHGGSAVALIFIFRGVSGAISASTDAVAAYMEGFAYLSLIAVALFLLIRAIADLAKGKSQRQSQLSLGALMLTGVYPCPGAILVLVLSLSLDILSLGIAAVLAMSIGMALPIALFAYLGWLGREGLLHRLKDNEQRIRKAGAIVEIVGFSILLLFSAYIALPFINGLTGLRI
jgi:ABC-type nickel/cobalt efflux system permease component RcnA